MFLFIVVTIIFILIAFLKSPTGKGWLAEAAVDSALGKNKHGVRYKLNNFIFMSNDKTVEIDHIFINKKGVFVIETKNYRGRISGTETSQEWTQSFSNSKKKFNLYSPIKQNKSHIYHLKRLLKNFNVTYHSIIVLYNNSAKRIKATTPVVENKELKKTIKNTAARKELSSEEIDTIYNFLINHKKNNVVSKRKHIKNVKTRLKNIDKNICPRCNGNLVERKGKYGAFMGCENYPNCKFIKR